MENSQEQVISRKWTLFKNQKIGEGAYGKVYKGKENTTGKIVAIKKIEYKKIQLDYLQLMKEIQMMMDTSEIDHPNLAKTLGHVVGDDEVYLVLELCEGTLQQLMKTKGQLTEQEAVTIGSQIVDGLYALHVDLGVSHRDLKIDNILIADGVFKITDFGMSTAKVQHSTKVGAYSVRPPEVLKGEKGDVSVDVWAFGVIMHEMMFQRLPFTNRGQNLESFVLSVMIDSYEIPSQPAISQEYRDMLCRCLEKDPSKRITIAQLKAHPCFSGKK